MNYIIRAVFNRPEMLYLSIKSEEAARSYFCNGDYRTLFCIESGAPPMVEEVIDRFYPFPHDKVKRSFRHYGWGNILEGLNSVCDLTDSYVLNFEDDCLIHKTYFDYIDKALGLCGEKCSVINASSRALPNRDQTAFDVITKTYLFEATCCLIFKNFYNKYVRPYATYDYYRNRISIISVVNKRNGDDVRSKYRPSRKNLLTHTGWDGLVNRLVDTAHIEEGRYCISPQTDRRSHIGFYGQNRPGQFPSNEPDFFKRVAILEDIVKDATKMSKLDGHYKDYITFSNSLEKWNGKLRLL